MQLNLRDIEGRIDLINAINTENNKARKQVSFKSSEIQGGRIEQYVIEKLKQQFNPESVREMPIVSSINIQNSVVSAKSTIYKKCPDREFTNTSDDNNEALYSIYKDMKLNQCLNEMNKNFNYQDQSIGMIVPKNGKLKCRILKMHQIDVIPSATEPEKAEAYIISAFDRDLYQFYDTEYSDYETATGYRAKSTRSTAVSGTDVEVAEKYQYQKYTEKYIVWTNELNFMMNGLGEIISGEDTENPLGFMPFFEVSRDKDFEYFVRSSNLLSNFTVEFNSALSDLQNASKMSAYAVALLKAPSELQPNLQVIGASMLLKLPTDDPDKEVDFDFVSPNPSISEISDSIDRMLNYFITSVGLNKNIINSNGETEKAMSGLDRFLMMLQKVEAHADDYEMFDDVEHDIFKIIKGWLSVLNNTDMLKDKYKTVLPDDVKLEVSYVMPEMIQSEADKLALITEKIEQGLISKRKAISELYNTKDDDKINEILREIENER